jgi:asparagine synthase (glutamine-hydrolysing)
MKRRVLGWLRGGGGVDAQKAAPRTTQAPWENVLADNLRREILDRREPAPEFRSERYEHHTRLTRAILCQTSRLLDRCAASGGVETRYPFMDRRLVEFCLSLPPDQKLQAGWTRSIMRRSLEGILPEDIRWRSRKANLRPGFSHGFATYDRERVVSTLSDPPDALGRFVNDQYRADVLGSFEAGSIGSREENMLFRIFALAYWLESLD